VELLIEDDCKNGVKVISMKNNAAANSSYPKGGVSCSKDSFVVKVPTFG